MIKDAHLEAKNAAYNGGQEESNFVPSVFPAVRLEALRSANRIAVFTTCAGF